MKGIKKKTSVSSKRWLLRQLNDPYVKDAKLSGYRTRSAFKLQEIQEKERIIRPGNRILDLGCAPGGWSQVMTELPGVFVWGVDLVNIQPIPQVHFFQGDFSTPETRLWIQDHGPFSGVVSDAAPTSTGHHTTDLIRIEHMVEVVWNIAHPVLCLDGFFLVKAFHTQRVQELYSHWRRIFKEVKYIKPKASRKESKEIYILARGYTV
ncbi:RlmE family RNA methyltransferase [Holospora curviuscula]|uniref:Ribosomal RNA large subunit methyltransferase E n=1 Tax=Holospora curviuscula TaxID=1082868 RepID=A0A2S5R8W3_9PROT|nr:RlmE family RNA methyltransferase [Holospora curviuscula]PPE03776.1 Ribosomal RNA large subunit methyltransferase E [Holospora curviuscula]